MTHYTGADPDFETDDYPGDFTEVATVTFPINDHGGKSVSGDGVTGNLTRTGIITAADGQEHTLAFWGQSSDLTSSSGNQPVFMSQRQQSGQARFLVLLKEGAAAHGKLQVMFNRWSNVNELIFTSSTLGEFDDDVRRQFVVACESTIQDSDLQNAIRVYKGKNGTRVAGTVTKVGIGCGQNQSNHELKI